MLEDVDKGKLVTYAAAALLILALALRWHAHSGGGDPPLPSVSVSPPAAAARGGAAGPAESARQLWVDVAGAVHRPGLYKVPAGSRVAAAIEMAGGVSRRGEPSGVNLAAPLRDGQQVIVPRRGSAALGGAGVGAGGGGSVAGASAGPISLSQASQAQLESLDGIGPALAGRILQYREQHGFHSLDELKEVSGIGDKRFEALRRSLVP